MAIQPGYSSFAAVVGVVLLARAEGSTLLELLRGGGSPSPAPAS